VNSSKRNIFVGGGEIICDPVADPVASKPPILGKLGGKSTSQIRGFFLALPQLIIFVEVTVLTSPHRFHSLDCITCRQEAVVNTAVQSTCRGAVTGGAVGHAQQIRGALAEVQVPDVPFADLGKPLNIWKINSETGKNKTITKTWPKLPNELSMEFQINLEVRVCW